MKYFTTLLILILALQVAQGQNLVPNPSFEQFDTCPSHDSQLKYATGWNSFGYSPDYYNSCSIGGFSTPSNSAGYQLPYTGNAYAGIGTYVNTNNHREYIGAKLINPLEVGTTYYVRFYVCLVENPSVIYASNKTGALFSTNSYSVDSFCIPPCTTTLLPPRNFAHVFSDNIITDTLNWTKISGSFIADSAYQYIIIGNLFDSTHTSVILLDSNTSYNVAYYFVDDIYVGTDSTGSSETNENQNSIIIYPNPATDNFNVLFSENEVNIKIYNLFGELVYEDKRYSGNNQINLLHFPAGIYLINIHAGIRIVHNKLILSH